MVDKRKKIQMYQKYTRIRGEHIVTQVNKILVRINTNNNTRKKIISTILALN
jgi:hypothetical protein